MYVVSVVSFNRKEVLRRTLAALERHTVEPYQVLVSDNGSQDGTRGFLLQYAEEHPGLVDLWLLDQNYGIAKARNAHWGRCLGYDVVRMDDKVEVQTPYWLSILAEQSRRYRSIMALTDPATESLWSQADAADSAEVPTWKCGAAMFIPAELAGRLGAWCEDYGLYGYEDLDYMDRAACLGWGFRYSLRARGRHLASAGPAGREYVKQFEGVYRGNSRAYADGERDLCLPLEDTVGNRLGQEFTCQTSLVRTGTALALDYP